MDFLIETDYDLAGSSMAVVMVLEVPETPVAYSDSGGPIAANVHELSCSTGTWINEVDEYSYQWQFSSDGMAPWADIEDATSSTYTTSMEEAGGYVRCAVTATNLRMSVTAYSPPFEVI